MYPQRDSNLGLWNTVPMVLPLSFEDTQSRTCFHIEVDRYTSIQCTLNTFANVFSDIKQVTSGWRLPFQAAPEGILT